MSKRGENIYKRKDNRWEARYIKGYRPNGSAQFGYCYAKTYREVRQKVTEAKSAIQMGKTAPSPHPRKSFAHYCDEWLRINRTRVKESTYVKYTSILENHIKPQFGESTADSLSDAAIEQFSRKLLSEQGLAPKTVKDVLTLLHSVLKYTAKQFPDMTREITIIYPKNPKKEMRVLSKVEQAKLVQYLLTDIDLCKFGVLLALYTGMRIGEVCALRWGDISLSNKTIKVSSTMQRLRNSDPTGAAKTKIVITEPKSDTSSRIIPLTDHTVELCNQFYSSDPAAFILTGDALSYLEPRKLQYRLKKYASDCNLSGIHFHVLRHTFATRCVEVGFEIKSLSEILGHSSPKITLERYIHSSLELKRDNMNKLTAIGF